MRMNRCNLGYGRWDSRRMSRLLDAPGLAAVLAEADPFRPSTEDKLEVGRSINHHVCACSWGVVPA